MRAFTDIFIKHPVLAVVVNLMIAVPFPRAPLVCCPSPLPRTRPPRSDTRRPDTPRRNSGTGMTAASVTVFPQVNVPLVDKTVCHEQGHRPRWGRPATIR